MDGEVFDRATVQLIRAEGCWLELAETKNEVSALKKQVSELENQAAALKTADTISQKIEENTRVLTRKEKRKEWFKKARAKLASSVLGVVALAQASYIIYSELKQ